MDGNKINNIRRERFESFVGDMFEYCGKPKPYDWVWEPEWLEEKIMEK